MIGDIPPSVAPTLTDAKQADAAAIAELRSELAALKAGELGDQYLSALPKQARTAFLSFATELAKFDHHRGTNLVAGLREALATLPAFEVRA